jgi:hypothetical protein
VGKTTQKHLSSRKEKAFDVVEEDRCWFFFLGRRRGRRKRENFIIVVVVVREVDVSDMHAKSFRGED